MSLKPRSHAVTTGLISTSLCSPPPGKRQSGLEAAAYADATGFERTLEEFSLAEQWTLNCHPCDLLVTFASFQFPGGCPSLILVLAFVIIFRTQQQRFASRIPTISAGTWFRLRILFSNTFSLSKNTRSLSSHPTPPPLDNVDTLEPRTPPAAPRPLSRAQTHIPRPIIASLLERQQRPTSIHPPSYLLPPTNCTALRSRRPPRSTFV